MEADSLGHNTKNMLTDSEEHLAIINICLPDIYMYKVDEVQQKGKTEKKTSGLW